MFHHIHKSLIFSLLASIFLGGFSGLEGELFAQAPKNPSPHPGSFDPNAGFRPAQRNLTSVFYQLAGSLEHYGEPWPYLRHIRAEHDRIAAKYREKTGREMVPYLPDSISEEYIEEMSRNWNELAPKLKLEQLTKDSGRSLRLAIDGEKNQGTSLILLFNWHADRVYQDIISGGERHVGYRQLREELLKLVNEGETDFLARRESDLSEAEQKAFLSHLNKSRFTKADFEALEAFYAAPYGRLSRYGKSLLSYRIAAGQKGEDIPAPDSEKYSREFLERYEVLFKKFDDQLSPSLAAELRDWVSGLVGQTAYVAHIEYELGIQDGALD